MAIFASDHIEAYAMNSTKPEPADLQALIEQTHQQTDLPQMLTGRLEGRFLKLLVQLHQPRLIVEIGMFTGYSALSMAEGLGDDGHLITCDIDPKARKIAQAAFDASPHGRKIQIRMGPAIETLRQLDQPIDFSFIDADKIAYPDYYELVVQRTRPGGVIVLDNMFMGGRVLDPQDPASKVVDQLNRTIREDDRVENTFLTIRDGVQLVRKKS